MKTIIYTIAIGLTTFASLAQSTQKRDLKDFSKIQAEGAANVVIKQGEPFFVEVKGNEKDFENIITEVNGNTLFVGTKGTIHDEIKVYVTMKELGTIVASGAASVVSDSSFNCNKLDVTASGASKVKMDLIVKELQTNLTGAATGHFIGAAENHFVFTGGASSLKAYKLTTVSTNITSSGASTAKINVNQKINVTASGASTVKYTGNPIDKVINVSGTASAKQVDSDEITIKLNDIDTTKMTWGDKFIDKNDFKWKSDFNNWSGIELNLNGFVGTNGSASLPATADYMSVNYGLKSLSWNLNLFEKNFHIYKNYVNLVTGIGFGFNAYQFKNPIRLNPDSSFTYYTRDTVVSFHKNKLKTSFIQIPLLFEFNTSKKAEESFHIAFGAIAGYKLGSKTLATYEYNGYQFEEKRKDDFNINPFKVDATVRIGYGAFTMFGTYCLTPLFENNKGPKLNTFSAGVRIIPF